MCFAAVICTPVNRLWIFDGRFFFVLYNICGMSWKKCVKFMPRFMKTGWTCLHRERATWGFVGKSSDSKQTEQGLQYLEAVGELHCVLTTFIIYYNVVKCKWLIQYVEGSICNDCAFLKCPYFHCTFFLHFCCTVCWVLTETVGRQQLPHHHR